MSVFNDGGAAYPQERKIPTYGHEGSVTFHTESVGGMTLRQAYAMAAMQGVVSRPYASGVVVARLAFAMADAMIKHEENEGAE